jgi:acyl phosphate:glycerol-3-phosphate acyltransferase
LLELGLKILFAYLLGSLMGALLVGAFRGVDIRELGSGNAGGTNALRTQGFWFAAVTVVIDVGKGWLAAGWLPGLALPGVAADPAIDRNWLSVACAAAAVIGHIWPQYHGFRGGKGGATLVGALLALSPWLVPVALAVWFVVAMLSGFVGLATMTAAAAMPVALSIQGDAPSALFAFTLTMAALVIFAHRSNIARMRGGNEPRLSRLWLLRPRNPP